MSARIKVENLADELRDGFSKLWGMPLEDQLLLAHELLLRDETVAAHWILERVTADLGAAIGAFDRAHRQQRARGIEESVRSEKDKEKQKRQTWDGQMPTFTYWSAALGRYVERGEPEWRQEDYDAVARERTSGAGP